ncbi:PCRF domain-containing protein [Patescibacteria group bacterium]|nr:PCRF domain-containing protein [Patescibacteria group bacterium]MBU0777146.1 PCRF domain-containing protein [Patescibacteria group bacterium]MBU0845840.1 PCRF domain-containing protein [Patescibacteria group bacterium]MBU0922867.1 PCRF domain-containing protein [Patescibacteria group bacterium]MBU1066400.1 PCRF domain-containing protein [Patescibacteria group bacterium]
MNNQTEKVYIEIRSAAGGNEAKIWATDLARMYTRYATKNNWKTRTIGENVIQITGPNVFKLLENESGVHRVQRVPATEKRGRIHTSTATVAVLPEIKEKEIELNPRDLEWQFYRASTHGGQNVQKVSTAVRLIHKPTGIAVTSEQERQQIQNREIARDLLRARLWEKQEAEKEKTIAGYRSAIGRGMRSEKIRTYNFPQNRVTDHRIKKSWGNLDAVINGDLEKIINFVSK